MAFLAFVTQLVPEPVMVFIATFRTNNPNRVPLRFKMCNTGIFIGELRTEFDDIHMRAELVLRYKYQCRLVKKIF